ncbi:hypothetical protein [Vulcanisaeta sp. JCM 14467]|uniref:hypothetical protein n=1 Tax=Vulcanisaeta sp. JCM 14467 TaxID=1295370 RepID=UPI0006D0AE68|nr:hypothetical protein [Vulcanisaeta sp. JCM 14467]
MLSLNDVVQAIYTVTRVVTVPINVHAIVYLAGRDWAMFERDGAYVVYKTTDTQGNPVITRLRIREVELPGGTHYYEVYGMEMQFKYMGHDFLAVYPVDGSGISKAKVDDKYLLDIGTKIGGGEPCIAALRIGQVPAICKQIGKFYLVIARM